MREPTEIVSQALTRDLQSFIDRLRRDPDLAGTVRAAIDLPAERARYAALDPPLETPIADALTGRGVKRLWTHQVEAISALRNKEDVLITTPTASGKSLVYQIPVLEEAAQGGPGRALFLFPLKALGNDQRAKLVALAAASGLDEAAPVAIYDGDTPSSQRQRIKRKPPRVLITNPDMLHLGILPYWHSWAEFLGELRWIVIDELHTYRGIFGSHFHHVLCRLLRIARALGARPQIVASSATVAGAGEFAQELTGSEMHWVERSGAPREGRRLLFVEPQASPYTTALHLLSRCLDADLKTIVFTKARRITELLFSWLERQSPDRARRVASYRSGFLPEERRSIEQRLADGDLDGVIATSALEMGIDIGGLDACILVGYPGSVMATWQRSGRVGRSGRESLTALVALPDALDQYFLAHPRELVERPLERLVVDAGNELVASAHLVAAAAEQPLHPEADRNYLEAHRGAVASLLETGRLRQGVDSGELFTPRKRPQREINLRGSGATFSIVESDGGAVLGTIDAVRVRHECHPGAVYLHAGRQYLVNELDLVHHRARVARTRVDYFTTPLTEKETEILEVLERRSSGPLRAGLARLRVTERVVGFERKRLRSQEVLDQEPLALDPVRFESVGLFWQTPPDLAPLLATRGEQLMGALHASEHAAISLFPLLALSDRGDIGGISYPLHPQLATPAVFIYDGHPGGVGISARGFGRLEDLLDRVITLLEECPCESGCPACVQSPKCGNGNRPLDKAGARHYLELLRGRGEEQLDPDWQAPEVELASAQTTEGEVTERDRESDGGRRPTATASRPPVASPAPSRKSSRTLGGGTLLFDLETQKSAAEVGGWGNAHRMLVAVGVACFLEEGRFEVYQEEDVPGLIAAMERAELVVGFNIRRFDYQVLSGYTGVDYGRILPTLDLLEVVHRCLGFRLPMNHLAQETLGVEKSANGLQSLEWFKQGRLDLISEYCRKDVEILRDLYLYGRRMGHLIYRDRQGRRVKLPVEW